MYKKQGEKLTTEQNHERDARNEHITPGNTHLGYIWKDSITKAIKSSILQYGKNAV